MSVVAQRVTVASTATRLDATGDADLTIGENILVRNRDAANSIFIGGSAVTAAAGYELLPNEAMAFNLATTDALYGITASANVICHVIQGAI